MPSHVTHQQDHSTLMTFIARLPYKVSHSPFPSDVDSQCGGVGCWPTSLAAAALARPSHSCSRQTPSPSFAAAGPSLCTTGWGGEWEGRGGEGRGEKGGERRGGDGREGEMGGEGRGGEGRGGEGRVWGLGMGMQREGRESRGEERKGAEEEGER